MPEKSGQTFPVHPPKRVERPMLYQSWNRATWIHWPYDPDVVQALLPAGLEVDTFDGTAWIGLVPFVIEDQRLPGTPALPWLSRAHETHFRTYATAPDGTGGSWFFYLENSLLPAVAGGRGVFWLNYLWSSLRMERVGQRIRYRGRRLLPPGTAHAIEVEIGEPHPDEELSELEKFVTAQWVLFLSYGRRLAAVQVEHAPWPVHHARLLRLGGNIFEAAGLPRPDGDPIVQFSPGVDSRIAFPRPIR